MFRQKSDNEREFAAVLKLLAGHRLRRYHTLRYTLNRLFRKNLREIYPADGLPVLSAANTIISRVSRPKAQWGKLANMQKNASYDGGAPIIVFQFRGMERLLDGHHRCRHWLKTNDEGTHAAIVLIITQDEAPTPPSAAH